MKVLILPDKFRGTLTSGDFIEVATAALTPRHSVIARQISDGGEGLLEAVGGRSRPLVVRGPLGKDVESRYHLLRNGDAVVEMALASGLALIGGATKNDPIAASTYGTGQLIRAAIEDGATHIVVGCGGSATTDGGWGALVALGPKIDLPGLKLTALVDVETTFLDAPADFAPQKGATPLEVRFLERRQLAIAGQLLDRFGRSPLGLPKTGAAGGLAGMLYCAGGDLELGFDYLSELLGLEELILEADLVLTGEGCLDNESFNGKVVGRIIERCTYLSRRIVVVVGMIASDFDRNHLSEGVELVSLAERYGEDRSIIHTKECLRDAIGAVSLD
ncbi:glycerate kinase [Acidithrix sp. C25]|uniref:glycerate kinase n=1 Tax=Acidithrix sp. C25 TaxID=1671482 RepID=UPI00191BC9BA|nr:glycerate kinase [Acidithrix sp. C25]